MVKYMGSKARHADEIIAIAAARRSQGQPWVEPFVGGGNVICRVDPSMGPRIGADKNPYMVAMLDALGNRGWLPPKNLTEDEWKNIRARPNDFPLELVAFAETGCTFGSGWGCGSAWGANQAHRPAESYRACIRDAPGLRGVEFRVSSYDQLDVPPESIIYCDPPYATTSDYKAIKRIRIDVGESLAKNDWDRVKFWRWADAMVDAGHQVFVSEYAGPPSSMYDVKDQTFIDKAAAIKVTYNILRSRETGKDRPSTSEYEELHARQRDLDRQKNLERERMAARWKVVWSKEVVSDFSSERGSEAKRETELLLHRDR